jgi:hypothetical protein
MQTGDAPSNRFRAITVPRFEREMCNFAGNLRIGARNSNRTGDVRVFENGRAAPFGADLSVCIPRPPSGDIQNVP